MRVVLLASGPFALPVVELLRRVSSSYPLVGVVTRPDRPARRGRKLQPTPVRRRCLELGLECHAPATVNSAEFVDELRGARPDLIVTSDYGEILKEDLLSLPPIGVFNLHASLLPAYRGAAPVAHALLEGEKVTGVSLFRMERGLDTGPVVAQAPIDVEPDETAGELEARLSVVAARLLEETLPAFADGSFRETPQDHDRATLAPKLTKAGATVDWDSEPERLVNFVRALNPWPVAFTHILRSGRKPERISLLRLAPGTAASRTASAAPGTVVSVSKKDLHIACRDGAIRILELQREGKAAMDIRAYLCGNPLQSGDRLGVPQE